MIPMSKKQRKLYNFIAAYRKKHEFSPTWDEVTKGMRKSKTAVYSMARTMERNGHLTIARGQIRGMETV